ncbi:MAG: hypothetical protein LBC02_01790 [Planctomycetaceae bacterium]|nr:hypothetical protein [Planctomycetaceae bacterium]
MILINIINKVAGSGVAAGVAKESSYFLSVSISMIPLTVIPNVFSTSE